MLLGEEEFKGVQVYDVIQDKKQNFWFSTNEGLVHYDHYEYRKVLCDESRGVSFFNFVINSKGQIFCNNLSNQIFKIENDSCTVFFELLPEETRADVHLLVTKSDELLVMCKSIYVFDSSGKLKLKHKPDEVFTGIPFETTNGQVLTSIHAESAIVYNGKQFVSSALKFSEARSDTSGILKFFRLNGNAYGLNLYSKKLYQFDEENFVLNEIAAPDAFRRTVSVRVYSAGNAVWVTGTLPGIVVIKDFGNQEPVSLFYPQVFISDVYEDVEGNILLSTFDHGVYVISDMSVPDAFPDFQYTASAIQTDLDLGIILGTSTGEVLSYQNGTFSLLHSNGQRSIEVIVNGPQSTKIIFDDGYIRLYDKATGETTFQFEAALKDGVVKNGHLFYLATNIGLVRVDTEKEGKDHIWWIDSLKFRNYAVELDERSGDIVVATVNGLFVMNEANEISKITFQGNPVYANALFASDGKIYASSVNSGVFVIEEKKVQRKIEPNMDGKKLSVFNFQVYQGRLFASTDEGLCEFDLDGNFKRRWSIGTGPAELRILDFDIDNHQLWYSTPAGLQQMDMNHQGSPETAPLLWISQVTADDERVNFTQTGSFEAGTRKFIFTLSSPTLKHKHSIRYHYKLNGYDPDWIVNEYPDHKIIYNALAPGEYEFQAKAENENLFSPVVSYKFSIAAPFYNRWWFYAFVALVFLAIVFLIYRRQLNLQAIKAKQINELNASKLTAIQSQMNPHFIFNSLNSIQDLVLKGDVEHSYSYITTFSNLVRRTLNYSDKEFIDFEQEVKLLELYLALEKLRFKQDLEFSLNTNAIADIEIPPMLIQPFIENALVHGLLHKQGLKKLTVSFELNNELICVIEDNGIGREEAQKINKRKQKDHDSFAVQAIRKRFEILSKHYNGKLGYTYEDRLENECACGTKVTLVIPFKRKF